jgi:tetratricopeptide (TPR) repeat protein
MRQALYLLIAAIPLAMRRVMKFALPLATTLVAGGLLAFPVAAFANDDGSNTPTCPRGQVYNNQKQKCVDAQSGVVDDQSLTAYAATLSREGRYDEALATLDLLQNPNTAVALNYRGYATRKLGHVDEGIGYYLKSVALDPEYTLVREYLGEAYVIKGDIQNAKLQLNEIEKRCGTTCESYQDLAEAIEQRI